MSWLFSSQGIHWFAERWIEAWRESDILELSLISQDKKMNIRVQGYEEKGLEP